jgi:hypothetical protein
VNLAPSGTPKTVPNNTARIAICERLTSRPSLFYRPSKFGMCRSSRSRRKFAEDGTRANSVRMILSGGAVHTDRRESKRGGINPLARDCFLRP